VLCNTIGFGPDIRLGVRAEMFELMAVAFRICFQQDQSSRPEMMTTLRQCLSLVILAAIFAFACPNCLPSSLVGKSDEELLHIMLGGKTESRLREDAKVKTHVPERFWEMAPKDAALALIQENCPTESRKSFQFVFDLPEKAVPPAKGEVGIRWRCGHCYIADEGFTALRYSGGTSTLSYSRVKSLDHVKKTASRQAIDATRQLSLPEGSARQLYETIWWLCHVRASKKPEYSGFLVSTGDGHATFWVSPDVPRTDVTLYFSDTIGDYYTNGIDESLYASFADLLLNRELEKRGANLNEPTITVGRERPLSKAERFVKETEPPDPHDATASRQWIDQMIELLRNPKVAFRDHVIDKLVPREEPSRYPDQRIDAALIEILNDVATPAKRSDDDSFLKRWTAEAAARALAWRDRAEVFSTFMILLRGKGLSNSMEEILDAAALIASRHAEFRPAMIDWLKDHPHFDVIWRGNFRELTPMLEKMATSSPDESELDLPEAIPKKDASRHSHRARAILMDWNEIDPLTKLKLDAILDASRCCFFRLPQFMFAEYKTLPPDQQKVFREFVERLDKQGQYAISTESLQQLFASQQADTATN
jgi:hypothetical protein